MAGLNNKVVLITGASSGVGAGTAVEFARAGSRLALSGRDVTKLQHTEKLCREAGLTADQILMVPADLSLEEDMDKLVRATVERFGGIDVLVPCAGIPMIRNTERITPDELDTVMNFNLRSQFMLTQKVVPYLIEAKGNIVFVSSSAGIRANPASPGYCCSKRGLDFMMKALALELGPKGVRSNGVNPSTVEDTVIYTKAAFDEKALPAYYDILRKNMPMLRLCKVKDVANAVVMLASDDSAFITGYSMPVDGGYRLKTGMNQRMDPASMAKKT